MRRVAMIFLGGAALWARPALAADALKYGPPPAWVHPQPIPAAKPTDAPVSVLMNDRQIAVERGKTTTYNEIVYKIENPQGLAAGNLSIVWQPAFDTVTINKVQIRRGDQVIDVLAKGQTFTVLRRETNLEAATLDGTLTGNIQPEGLQEGDIVDFATTSEESDPVLKGHVEATFGGWNTLPIQSAHASLSWPKDIQLNVRESANLPAAQRTAANGKTLLELSASSVQPLVPPNGAPLRFQIGRLAEATDFASWGDLADLFIPLFRDASVIPSSGPLHDEVEKIRTSSANPKQRAEQALTLVQDQIRYVALLMGQGGYVPAPAETTWSRRFGDCKAKTALLLGILHSLGIEAEPVLVQSKLGDMIPDRLPMIALFDHVLVRAHIGGKDYWLDATRTGDTDLDSIKVPDFGWGLPLVEHAQLVRMVPGPLQSPNREDRVSVDASAGIYSPANITIEEIYRGDTAVELNTLYSAATAAQRDEQMHDEAKSYFDTFEVASSSIQFDKSKGELDIVIKGTGKLNWKDTWAFVPTSSIAFDPDFDRPAGPLHDVPIAVNHPRYVKDQAIIRLPPGFAARQKLSAPIDETLAGVEYSRSETVDGDVLTVDSSERSLVPEVSYKEALAAASRLKSLSDDDVYLSSSVDYRATPKDIAALAETTPGSADEYVSRGNLYLNAAKYDEAIADYTSALKLDEHNEWALADRGLGYVWKRQFENAEKDLDVAAARNPNNAVVARAEGLMAEFKGDCSTSVASYTKSLSIEPGNSFALGHRAICEADLLKFDAALTDSAAALSLDPTWTSLRVLRANIFMRQGKRELVSAEADAMSRASPNSDYAWVGAAKTYAALGERDRAMAAMDRALAIKPEAYIYINRAQVRPESDFAGRMADIDKALQLEPKSVDALSVKASFLSDAGDYPKAVAIYDELLKTSPGDSFDLQRDRAVALYKAGRSADAEAAFQQLAQSVKTATQSNSLCWSKATAGIFLDSALQDCRDALKKNPDNGAYLDSLGMVLLKLGKLDEALAAYDQAIAKGIGADSLMGRAFVYLKRGDRAHAEADAAAARKLFAKIDDTFADYGLKFDGGPAKTADATSKAAAATKP